MRVGFIVFNDDKISEEICQWTKKSVNTTRESKEVIFDIGKYYKITFSTNYKSENSSIEIVDKYIGYNVKVVGKFDNINNKCEHSYKKFKKSRNIHYYFNTLVDIDLDELIDILMKLIPIRKPHINIIHDLDMEKNKKVLYVNIVFSKSEYVTVSLEQLESIFNLSIQMKLYDVDEKIKEIQLKLDKSIDTDAYNTYNKLKKLIEEKIISIF